MPDPTAPDPTPAPTPLPVPQGTERVVLFGGSFDPPTLAHAGVAAAARALAAGPGAWLVFVPAARSPFKSAGPTADQHRVAMLELVAGEIDRAAVWTDELDRASGSGASYWVDTLGRARSLVPSAELWFLIGGDQAAEFHRWREARAILRLARPVVVLREPYGSAGALDEAIERAGFWSLEERAAWGRSVVELPARAGSATEARALLGTSGGSDAALAAMLGPAVLGYIRKHGLYGQSRGLE